MTFSPIQLATMLSALFQIMTGDSPTSSKKSLSALRQSPKG
ncbi:hypothetical protein FDUTEX481_05371 [Tolypothrix sp. PCC 7601]|nr:hypothetical protein FDUTEX481_05371 [Tolypothrix sp. PCC 7601]